MLCAVSSKKTLLGLWADLKNASKTEFEAEVARAQAVLAGALDDKPQPKSTARREIRDDRPASRLMHHLTEKLGLAEKDAAAALTAKLREAGVDPAKIPNPEKRDLADWLEALLDKVSGSVVMGAAQRIGK